MKKTISILILLIAFAAKSQTIQQIDSLNNQICISLKKLNSLNEAVFEGILVQHMPDFYTKHKIDTQVKSDSLLDLIYFRLQKNCDTFVTLLNQLEENKSDWEIANQKPKTNISDRDLKKFFSLKNLHYKEYDGKKVLVTHASNLWTEKFEDGTFSKLELKQTSKATFTLKFIESNNEMRKNLSVKGEEYNYGICDKGENYYSIWVLSKEGTYYTSRIYID